MQRGAAEVGGRGAGVRRRERLRPARRYAMKVYLSDEERQIITAGAAAVGMTPAGFTARAALDAAVVGVVPVGARSALQRLVGFQVELAAVRRKLDLLRSQLTAAGPACETVRRCAEAADELTQLSRTVHRRLGSVF